MGKLKKPERHTSSVSLVLRRWTDAPADALDQCVEALKNFDNAIASSSFAEDFAIIGKSPALVPLAREVLAGGIWRLRKGKADADAIRAHLSEHATAGLGPYLKKHPVSVDCIVWLLAENRRLALSLAASEAAGMKNKTERDYVAKAWAERTDTGQSKASFARMIEHEVKRRFGVSVTPDRIARYWLPKG